MAEWSLDLSKYAEKQKVEIKEVRKAFAFALFSSIVKNTPVGHPDFDESSGRARANWNISVGHEDTSVTESTQQKVTSASQIRDPNGDESIYISNNLPYINKLEYGGYPDPPDKGSRTRKGIDPARYEVFSQGGFSKKAPNGMVGVTVANSANIFDAAARTVTKG